MTGSASAVRTRGRGGVVAGGGVVAVATLVWVFGWVLPAQREEDLAEWRQRLTVVADARQAAVERWVAERVGDAKRVASFPTTKYLLAGKSGPPFPFPEGEGAAAHLQDVLDVSGGVADVAAVYVLTAQLEVAAASAGAPALRVDCLETARNALASRASVVGFHSHDDGSTVVAAATIVEPPAASANAGPLGVAMVTADPARWLFPLLTAEHAVTATGETLLVRPEGDDILFASPRRHEGRTLVALERHPRSPALAAAAAVDGVEGVGNFLDVDGEPVLAATRRIPGADWALVVKVDRAEALAPFHTFRRGLLIQTALGLMTLAATAWAWRRREQAKSLAAIAAGHAERAALLDQANDAVLFVDPEGRILEVNRRAEEMYHRTAVELTGMTVHELCAPADQLPAQDELERGIADGILFETVHRRGDGSEFPVEVSSRLVRQASGDVVLSTVRDISERRAAETRILELNRLLRTISEVNQLILREPDPKILLEGACEILVQHGGFRLAWVGLEASDGGIEAVAASWSEPVPDDAEQLAADRRRMDTGPPSVALRESRPVIVQDWRREPQFPSTREAAAKTGVRSSYCGPLEGSIPRGVIAVGSAESGAFTDEIAALLSELSGDLSLALASRDAAARLQVAFDEAAAGMAVVSPDGRLLRVNNELSRMLGIDEDGLLERSVEELCSPDDPGALGDLIGQLATRDTPIRALETRLVDDRGEILWALTTAFLHRDALGRPAYAILHLQDVTERRRVAEQVRETGEVLRAVVDAAPVAIYTLTLDGVVTLWNPAAERMFGWTAAEAIGRPLPIVPEDRQGEFARLRGRVARGEWFMGVELERRRRDGSAVRISVSTAPLRGPKDRVSGILAIAADVTAQRQAEERLQHAQRMEAIGRLAGGIAHDFNNLLQVMMAQVDLMTGCGDDPASAAEVSAELADAVRRGAALTRQLLLFSRRETTRLEDVNLLEVLNDSARMLRRLVRENVQLTAEGGGEPLVVHADRAQLEQVVFNLVVNATDAIPDGGAVILRARRGPEDTVALEVEDTGPGIPPELREAVLEPFFTTKKPGQGTGLGLAVVHGIAARLQGRVEIHDGAQGGALVRVVLPVVGSTDGRRRGPAEPDRGGGPTLAGRRVLLVEDQDQARAAFSRLLGRLGLVVQSAASVAEAEASATASPPDLLLTDVGLPDGSGAELAAALRARQPELKVIIMSGYAPPDQLPEELVADHVRFLQKPFDLASLSAAVLEAVGSVRRP